jgi:hypothetical protein
MNNNENFGKDIKLPIKRPEIEKSIITEEQESLFNNEYIDPDKRRSTKVPYSKIRNKRNKRNKIAKMSRRKNRKK